MDRNLAKKSLKIAKKRKNRESLFTFWLSITDPPIPIQFDGKNQYSNLKNISNFFVKLKGYLHVTKLSRIFRLLWFLDNYLTTCRCHSGQRIRTSNPWYSLSWRFFHQFFITIVVEITYFNASFLQRRWTFGR